ncbi:MAG TPA: EF-hand domain-containing protein [Planctomycetota bacterium]|nr:EF-hand domain-containing protein [Planctomycetota bacterium]
MKMITLLCALLVGLTLHAGDPAKKGGKREGGNPEKEHRKHEEMLKRFDKDGDGKLSEEEKRAAMEAMGKHREGGEANHKAEIIKRFDKDGDGTLNEEEKRAAMEAMGRHKGEAKREAKRQK